MYKSVQKSRGILVLKVIACYVLRNPLAISKLGLMYRCR